MQTFSFQPAVGRLMGATWLGLGSVLLFAYLAIIILVAASIYRDARVMRARGSGCFLFGPAMWAILTFITGLVGGPFGPLVAVTVYWLIHHSNLRPRGPGDVQEPKPSQPPLRPGRSGGIID